jgi:hypothetical protein
VKLTNRLGLPLPIVKAVENDGYNAGRSDISVTSLIDPPRIQALKKRHWEELEEDVSDRLYSLQGQSVHTILERAAEGLDDSYLVERRFYIDLALEDGSTFVLSGQVDIFDIQKGILADYKLTSVYSVKGGPKEEYVKQVNIGRLLLEEGYELVNPDGSTYRHGVDDEAQVSRVDSAGRFKVHKLQIVALLRDWSKGEYSRECQKAEREGWNTVSYPAQQTKVMDVPIIARQDVINYVLDRAQAHKVASTTPEPALPVCTSEERWERPGKYAIMKPGASRASKLFDTKEEAEAARASYDPKARVEARPGESIRCAQYCPVASKCSVAKQKGWTRS